MLIDIHTHVAGDYSTVDSIKNMTVTLRRQSALSDMNISFSVLIRLMQVLTNRFTELNS